MIESLRLIRYKGFEEYRLHLRSSSFLIGPNNAGKSTIMSALRLCGLLVHHAKQRRTDFRTRDVTRNREVAAYSFNPSAARFVSENLRYELRFNEETRLELKFKNKAMLYVVWPADEDAGFYYLEHLDGIQPRNVREVRLHYPTIAVVPTLTPIEHREAVLSPAHVKENYTTRLASRHFRNQLKVAEEENADTFDELREFFIENTPEVDSLDIDVGDLSSEDPQVNVYYREGGFRVERELSWSGDGVQIWLQVLFHLWRLRDSESIILDEPDVFLHPDLQRRLVWVLEELRSQVVVATHAPEVLTEARRDSIIMVDRLKKRSRRVSDERVRSEMNEMLGSGFNLRLVKALRARVALFVEGDDMTILKNVARAVNASRVARERGVTVVPIRGLSNRGRASSFGWLNKNVLDEAVKIRLILDRDYYPDAAIEALVAECEKEGVEVHVWRRKELESYLISVPLLSRLSGCPEEEVSSFIEESLESLKTDILTSYLQERRQYERAADWHDVSIDRHYIPIFEESWSDPAWRLHAAPAKKVLSDVNRKLQEAGYKAAGAQSIAKRIQAHEVPTEMRDVLLDIEAELA